MGKELIAQCKWLEKNIDSNGPYFMGEQFSLVASRPRSPCVAKSLEQCSEPCRAVLCGPCADIVMMQCTLALRSLSLCYTVGMPSAKSESFLPASHVCLAL